MRYICCLQGSLAFIKHENRLSLYPPHLAFFVCCPLFLSDILKDSPSVS